MLEGLTRIRWDELEHAYGSAEDVPDHLIALRSPDPEVREKARWHLYGNIFHQGTRYEATAYAVPFLLELLADPATPERSAILELLTSLAIGYDETWLPEGFPIASYRQRAAGGERLLGAAPELADDEDNEGRYTYYGSLSDEDQQRLFAYIELAVHDAVRVGVPLFRTLLADDSAEMRTVTAYALGWFGEDGPGSVPALVGAAGDPQAEVAATALVALGLVGTGNTDAARTVDAALADPRDVVRWGAAVAAARLHGPAADPRVAAELLSWSGGQSDRRAGVPFHDGDLAGYACLALRQLGDAQADPAFDALLARIPGVSGPEALPATSP
ncbi:hypothetical protein [Micromonospora sp. NPDC004704]